MSSDFISSKYISESISSHLRVVELISNLEKPLIEAINLICHSLATGQKIIFCGNGGSAADSQHLAAEFSGRFTYDRKALAGFSLTTDSSVITSIANDFSFDQIFSRQLYALARKGDCLIAISTSGNSLNIVNAVKTANKLGLITIGLLGNSGGLVGDICNINLTIPSYDTARIQEAHILIGHILCGAVERQMNLVEE
jgi:D-sedoheptulose 7-phosphate isomerase